MSDASSGDPPQPNPQVFLAIERTMLAWIRTGLALMGFGFVVARFGLFMRTLEKQPQGVSPENSGASLYFGIALILFGVLVQVLAGWQYVVVIGRLRRGEGLRIVRSSTGLILISLLVILGVAMTVYLISVAV